MTRTDGTPEVEYEQLELLEAIEKNVGMVPGILRLLADSSLAFRTGLGIHHVADEFEYDSEVSGRAEFSNICLGSL